MPRNENPIEKTESLGHLVKVQRVIDFMVLSDLINGQRYHSEMEQFITQTLGNGVGVNDAYFSKRLQVLYENGHVTRHWDGDNRYNRFYRITDAGIEYFKLMLRELPGRVSLAKQVYDRFDAYLDKFGHVHLK
ncbi:helix-turn-helix transcriptional regulator [Paenibacillus sp. MWE-103]|uniref:Helix-turn-helix transcriptional regulator n=1 Tax=Paenibacillus artemisiicola TaxID=1172618 RepID=A0ABS3WFA8_9BACL|nr:helix-turn-helix transcriptional regulator [Paenibacillus artemisiicola]MBO7747006.1 helix-turn-helix transcriptional regulator [Paenibacillus artemisiicola]